MNKYINYGNPQWKPSCPVGALPSDSAVTMAYVPYQTEFKAYCPEIALQNGTLFPSLDKPFFGGKCR